MNEACYWGILKREFKKKVLGLLILKPDNVPEIMVKLTQNWFNSNKVNVLKYPSQCPDSYPIKNIWR